MNLSIFGFFINQRSKFTIIISVIHWSVCINATIYPAIDSISHFKIYSDFAIHKNYCTTSYRDKFKSRPGKLGCNLSHQLLLDTIHETSDTEWNLILEDDVHIDINVFMKDVQRVLQHSQDKQCDTQPRQLSHSSLAKNCVSQTHGPEYWFYEQCQPLAAACNRNKDLPV